MAGLYDRFFEYADLLATQGLIDEAVKLLDLIPTHYKGSIGAKFDCETARDRLLRASGKATPSSKQTQAAYASTTAGAAAAQPYGYAAYGTA